jgi:hypothetical protein
MKMGRNPKKLNNQPIRHSYAYTGEKLRRTGGRNVKDETAPDFDKRALWEYRRNITGNSPDSAPKIAALPDGRYRLEIGRKGRFPSPKSWILTAIPTDPETLLASVADPDPLVFEFPTFPRNLLQSLLMIGPLSLEEVRRKLGSLVFAGKGLDSGLVGVAARFTEEERTPGEIRDLLADLLWSNLDLAGAVPGSSSTVFAHLASVAGNRVMPWHGYAAWMARDAALVFLESSVWRLPFEAPQGTWNDHDPLAKKAKPTERTGEALLEAIADYFEGLRDHRFPLVCSSPEILRQFLAPHVGFLRGLFLRPDGDPLLAHLLKMERKTIMASMALDWAIQKTGADTDLKSLIRRHMANRAIRPDDGQEIGSPLL